MKIKDGVRFNAYAIIDQAVENGIECGYRRAFKHSESPDEFTIKSEVQTAVMNALCEVLEFGDE